MSAHEIDPLAREITLFAASMPASYRATFDDSAIAAHAAIASRRGASATRVEMWRELPERVVAICVVADDRAGLLSRISAALVAHDIDIVAAQAYGRTRSDLGTEAVDLLWIRRLPGASGAPLPIREKDVLAIGETLDALVRGRASFEVAVRLARAIRSAAATTSVRFEDHGKEHGTVLTIHADDRPGLLLIVTRALFREGVQIVGSRISSEGGRAVERFVLAELDGAPLRSSRLLALQTAVLVAIQDS
jgi:UTP:GlnB (protein PII) uridylyltransferase